uniref:Uncharacterized protein n=1 Tax=Clastoptera arizonana TaxID=38151 RepID=A0A1B6DKV6_9HEMI
MSKTIEIPSDTGGVKPIPIEGRMARERERLAGMTDAERKWRAQFLKDQYLSPNEPRFVPEIREELINPIRRFYQKPLDLLFKALTPVLGEKIAFPLRVYTGKIALTLFIVYATAYNFKYNANDWTRRGGWIVFQNQEAVLPGHPQYPKLSDRSEPHHYASRGFENSPI